jgi:hypothetical protein
LLPESTATRWGAFRLLEGIRVWASLNWTVCAFAFIVKSNANTTSAGTAHHKQESLAEENKHPWRGPSGEKISSGRAELLSETIKNPPYLAVTPSATSWGISASTLARCSNWLASFHSLRVKINGNPT